MDEPRIILLPTMEATRMLAQRVAPLLRRGDVALLEGALGAGKTAFARCLLQTLGVQGEIPSPTFTLVQGYDTKAGPAFHFDLYRLKQAQEIEEIGFDEACAEGIVVVEWPEKARSFMPRDALVLRFAVKDQAESRTVQILASPSWQTRLKGVFDAN